MRTAAAWLGVCEATVYKLCAEGTLPHYRVSNSIRIAPSDLEAALLSFKGPSAALREKGNPR